MTFAEMQAETRSRVEDLAGVFFSDDDVADAVNEGYEELSDATEWFEVWATIDLLDTRPYYDLRHLFPYEVLIPGAAFNEQTNRWLEPSNMGDLDGAYRHPETVYTQPTRLIARSLYWLRYFPLVQQDAGTIKQYATCVPPRMALDRDTPGFPATYHRGCVEYAISVLAPQQGEVHRALEAWDAYLAYETGLQAWKDGRAASPMVRGYGAHPR